MGGGGKVMGEVTGANEAAREAASAAQGAARAQRKEASKMYKSYADYAIPATTAALASFDQSIAAQEKNLARQEQMAAQIDPTIIEASQQALKLLRGEDAASLNPLKNQRTQQRQKLLNSLREQLGPGAETSSAGIQALTQFDSETSNLLSSAQQSSLSQMGSIAGQFRAAGPDILREASGLGALAQNRYGVASSTGQGLFNARQPLFNTAGYQFTGQQVMAQHQMSQANAFANLAVQAGTAAATSGLSSLGGSVSAPTGGGSSLSFTMPSNMLGA